MDNQSPAKQAFATRNTSGRSVTVIFEPWLTEVTLEPERQLDIEVHLEDSSHLGTIEDLRPHIWIGEDGHVAIHCPRMGIPRAFLDGSELQGITY